MFKKILSKVWSIRGYAKRFCKGQAEVALSFLRKKFCFVWDVTQAAASENLV